MENEKFKTGELYLAAYLQLKLAAPEMVLERGRVLFTFEKSDELYQLCYQFNSGALVDVCAYTEAIKALKAAMYEVKSTGVMR